MSSKSNNPHHDPIVTKEVLCAWMIAVFMLAMLAFMGYSNASLPFTV